MMKLTNYALILGSLFCVSAMAQNTAPTNEQPTAPATPLNLDADNVVKEISKEQPSVNAKSDTLSSSTKDPFEQSMLDSENRKKVTGIVEAGAGVGSVPAQRGFKGQDINCEYTAAAVSDQISSNAQVAVSAYANTCKVK